MKKRWMAFLMAAAMAVTMIPSADVFAAQSVDTGEQDMSAYCGLESVFLEPEEMTAEEAEAILESDTEVDYKMSGTEYEYWMQFSNDYYYDQLDETEQSIWRKLEKQCVAYLIGTSSDAQILYSGTSYMYDTEYSIGDVYEFIQMFRYAHPQFYFVSNSYGAKTYTYTTATSTETWYVPFLTVYDAVTDPDDRAEATSAFRETVDDWVSQIEAYSDVEVEKREKAAHDIVCENTVYASNDWDQSAYSVVCLGESVCAGYALAFQILMNAVGIETIEVTSANHAWNMVNIHGIWYETDTTWDDGDDSAIRYTYYNRSFETVCAEDSDHVLDSMWTSHLPDAIYDSFTTDTYQDAYFWNGDYEYFMINSNTSLGKRLAGAIATIGNARFAAAPDTVEDANGTTYTTVDLYEDDTEEIAANDISQYTVTLSYTKTTYNGNYKKPTPTVTATDGTVLTKNTDYTVAYANNQNVGTATVTITGIGDYTGTLVTTFTIKAAGDLTKCTAKLNWTKTTYTGSKKCPGVTVKTAKGTTLKKGTNYTVSYSNNVNAGIATVTITGIGKYSGTLTKTFKIRPVKPTGVSATATKTTVKVTFNRHDSADKYYIYVDGKYKGCTKTKNYYTIKGLTSGTTYKVSVKAVTESNGENVYSLMSSSVSVTTKN